MSCQQNIVRNVELILGARHKYQVDIELKLLVE